MFEAKLENNSTRWFCGGGGAAAIGRELKCCSGTGEEDLPSDVGGVHCFPLRPAACCAQSKRIIIEPVACLGAGTSAAARPEIIMKRVVHDSSACAVRCVKPTGKSISPLPPRDSITILFGTKSRSERGKMWQNISLLPERIATAAHCNSVPMAVGASRPNHLAAGVYNAGRGCAPAGQTLLAAACES